MSITNKHNCTTLCYIEKEDAYLMMHRVKKEKDINKDKWVGVGGHFEEGESPEECLLREVWEETGLTLDRLEYRGIVTFVSDRYPTEWMHLFYSDSFHGTLKECDEGNLEWVKKEDLKKINLWEGDFIFLELLDQKIPFFSLKLCYRGDELQEALLNGRKIR